MNILIPMAGAGQRFIDEGYTTHKPAILTIDRNTGEELPMVVCATKDLPGVAEKGANLIYIDRDFHKSDGVENIIQRYYPKSQFITIDYLTEGQASTCLLAKELIDNEESLLISASDNGMVFNEVTFNELTQETDAIVFTYRNNPSVLIKPSAYGWVDIDQDNNIKGVSVKKALSDNPMNDHAIVATFWFKTGHIFVEATEKMIQENDRINNEFYVDNVINHLISLGYRAKILEIDRYIGWGTPKDYEAYTKSYRYWEKFVEENLAK